YYETRPKPCMQGWGSLFLAVTADGLALPCHSARMLPGLTFPNVREHNLRWIWNDSPAFNAYRGEDWMQEPCRTCPEKAKDFGGCRCQAYLMTGDATHADPVCDKSPFHSVVTNTLERVRKLAAGIETEQPLYFRDDANSLALTAEAKTPRA